jgi:hypothetical protein
LTSIKRTWNENPGKTQSAATGTAQAEIGQKRGELAAREWRRLHGVQHRATSLMITSNLKLV